MVLLGHAYAAMPRVRRLESQSSLGTFWQPIREGWRLSTVSHGTVSITSLFLVIGSVSESHGLRGTLIRCQSTMTSPLMRSVALTH